MTTRRRDSGRDIQVFRDPGRANSGYAGALLAIERAKEKHVTQAHDGDAFAPSVFDCARCRELDEAEERLLETWTGDTP